MKLVECVPNFSEAKNTATIEVISNTIRSIDGVTLLDVDSGADTNRTVMTFVGTPERVSLAAFNAIKIASELIDMSKHEGSHSRIGATDVCPFIPISEISIDECKVIAEKVADQVGSELGIPVYLYERSAKFDERKNLANIRKGEYEGLKNKLKDPKWSPDYGPSKFNVRSGATAIGVRDFLIAYNINLNTKNTRIATDIAFEIREKGRSKRIPNPNSPILLDGEIERNGDGTPKKIPGIFKDVKAVGWYVDEFKRAQISINFNNYKKSTIHHVYDKVCDLAQERGVRVTGSELVGLIPLDAILMAGKYFLLKQRMTTGIPIKDIIEAAMQGLGLNDVTLFDPNEKIIEYAVSNKKNTLMSMNANDLIEEFSLKKATPGGGSASALGGSLGASLCSMVSALTFEKASNIDIKNKMLELGENSQKIMVELSECVDNDAMAFNSIILANRLPSDTKELEKIKNIEVEKANKLSVEVPFKIASLSLESLKIAKILALDGYKPSISDVSVASELSLAGFKGAMANVLINLPNIKDQKFINKKKDQLNKMINQSEALINFINNESTKIIDG